MNRGHYQRAIETVTRSNAEAALSAREAERKWWFHELEKWVADMKETDSATELLSKLLSIVEKRSGKL